MKIYISADIEGVCGIAHWNETTDKGSDYNFFRQEMTKEVLACIEGLMEAGVKEIVVRDAHDSARNLDISAFPENVKIIRNWSGGICSMMDGLDESFDGVVYIGYHSPCRDEGNPLSHTQNTNHVHLKINTKIVSEYLLNTYYAQTKSVPAIMISGDEKICQIAENENSLIKSVPTKSGLHGAVISKQPTLVYKEIKQGAIEAIKLLKANKKQDFFVFTPRSLDLEVQYKKHSDAYRATFYPGAKRLSDDKTTFYTNDIIELLTFMMFCD